MNGHTYRVTVVKLATEVILHISMIAGGGNYNNQEELKSSTLIATKEI